MSWHILLLMQYFCLQGSETQIVWVGEMESPSSDNTEQLLSNYRVKFDKTKMILKHVKLLENLFNSTKIYSMYVVDYIYMFFIDQSNDLIWLFCVVQ